MGDVQENPSYALSDGAIIDAHIRFAERIIAAYSRDLACPLGSKRHDDADQWFRNYSNEPLSFLGICDGLDVNSDVVRKGIYKLVGKQREENAKRMPHMVSIAQQPDEMIA